MHNHGNGITSWVAAAVVIAVLIFMIRWATPGEPAALAEDAPAMEDVALEEVPSTPVAEAPVASMAPAKKAPTPAPVAVAKSTPAPKPKPLATTAPAPAAAAPKATPPTVTKAVNTWAKCWADQDVSCYLAAYSAEFVPASGASLESWKASRTQKVSAPASITVDLGPLQLVKSTDTRVTVQFEQEYRSSTYADKSLKTLVLVNKAGAWKIVRETSADLP